MKPSFFGWLGTGDHHSWLGEFLRTPSGSTGIVGAGFSQHLRVEIEKTWWKSDPPLGQVTPKLWWLNPWILPKGSALNSGSGFRTNGPESCLCCKPVFWIAFFWFAKEQTSKTSTTSWFKRRILHFSRLLHSFGEKLCDTQLRTQSWWLFFSGFP